MYKPIKNLMDSLLDLPTIEIYGRRMTVYFTIATLMHYQDVLEEKDGFEAIKEFFYIFFDDEDAEFLLNKIPPYGVETFINALMEGLNGCTPEDNEIIFKTEADDIFSKMHKHKMKGE